MKLGKYELNKIYNEDCYEAIKNIPDKSIDLIITDPPYEWQKGGEMTGLFRKGVSSRNFMYQIESKQLDKGIDYSILDEYKRVLKKINIYIYGVIKTNFTNIWNILLERTTVTLKLSFGTKRMLLHCVVINT